MIRIYEVKRTDRRKKRKRNKEEEEEEEKNENRERNVFIQMISIYLRIRADKRIRAEGQTARGVSFERNRNKFRFTLFSILILYYDYGTIAFYRNIDFTWTFVSRKSIAREEERRTRERNVYRLFY